MSCAAGDSVSEEVRVLALNALADWEEPSPLDRVVGLWRPLTNSRVDIPQQTILPIMETLLQHKSEKIVSATVRGVRQLKLKSAAPSLFRLFEKENTLSALRIQLLQTLAEFKATELSRAVEFALAGKDTELRAEAVKVAALMNPMEAAPMLGKLLVSEQDDRIRRSIFETLGELKDEVAGKILAAQMEQLLAGKISAELQLDVIEAASKHSSPVVQEALKKYESRLSQSDPLGPFRICLTGGEKELGKKIFVENDAVGCLRCHAIKGKGGIVGPGLSGIASRHPREYLLESVLFPNKAIAPGFESVVLQMKNGVAYAGMVKSETDQDLVLNSPEDGVLTLKKAEIEKRERSLSPMPDGIAALLNKRDLRNLVEYLATLK
jgi:quinoprotein glucose dehydrogenase